MKILFLSRRFYPDDGGVEKHIREISKFLIDKGYELTLVTQTPGATNNYKGIKIVRIPKTPKKNSEKLYIWKWFWNNKHFIIGADVVHAHDVYWWYWPYRFIFLSKKSFVTFHGYETYPIRFGAILSRKISEILSNGNIIVGDFMKKWYHTTPNYVIYGGVDLLVLRSKNHKARNQKSAVFMGRLDEHTGILDYAKAIDEIRKKHPEFKFEILGEGPYIRNLKKYKLIGFKKDVNKYFQENNFAFVSRYLSILEALANKRLVIAHFDNPVKEDYLKMAPFSKFIIIENSPEKIAGKVDFYLKNKRKKDELVNKGYEWVSKQNWENIIRLYLKLWLEY